VRQWVLAGLLVSMSVVASAAEVAGIKLDERIKLGTSELVLNGAGVRRRFIFKAYVAGLYLPEKRRSTMAVFALAGPKRASITLLRDVPAQELVDAMRGGIRDNTSLKEQQTLKARVDEVAANLLSIRWARKGDVITVDWYPDVGTVTTLNGEVEGKPIPGYDVYRALLRVWLGDSPTSAGLKKALLGQMD
jgi:chalcone isomerase-like protein